MCGDDIWVLFGCDHTWPSVDGDHALKLYTAVIHDCLLWLYMGACHLPCMFVVIIHVCSCTVVIHCCLHAVMNWVKNTSMAKKETIRYWTKLYLRGHNETNMSVCWLCVYTDAPALWPHMRACQLCAYICPSGPGTHISAFRLCGYIDTSALWWHMSVSQLCTYIDTSGLWPHVSACWLCAYIDRSELWPNWENLL